MSLTVADGFFTTETPAKPSMKTFLSIFLTVISLSPQSNAWGIVDDQKILVE